jgi:hypothetical protein
MSKKAAVVSKLDIHGQRSCSRCDELGCLILSNEPFDGVDHATLHAKPKCGRPDPKPDDALVARVIAYVRDECSADTVKRNCDELAKQLLDMKDDACAIATLTAIMKVTSGVISGKDMIPGSLQRLGFLWQKGVGVNMANRINSTCMCCGILL